MTAPSHGRELEVTVKVDAGVELRGLLHGVEPFQQAALVCHPHPAFGGTMDVSLVRSLCRGLSGPGCAALRFDFRGVGRSTGRATGGEQEHEDVLACLSWLRDRSGQIPHLVGYSFGAAMALSALIQGGEATYVCCIGLPTVTMENHAELISQLQLVARSGQRLLFLSGDQDQFSDPAWIEQTLTGPGVTVETLPGQGHFFEGDAERRLVKRVKAFLTF